MQKWYITNYLQDLFHFFSQLSINIQQCIIHLIKLMQQQRYEPPLKRKQVPEDLKPLLQVSKYVTLYLIRKYAQTKMLFADPIGNQHLVQIGEKVSCSCLPGFNDHCIHTLYVMLKVYKLDQDDPWIFQKTYLPKQLLMIINGQRKKQWKLLNRDKESKKQSKNTESLKQFIKQRRQIKGIKKKQEKKHEGLDTTQLVQIQIKQIQKQVPNEVYRQQLLLQTNEVWPDLDNETICSICHECINNETPIISCIYSCKNYFHTQCLKFWIKHKKKEELQVSCPMCRSQFAPNIQQQIINEQKRFVKIFQSHNLKCNQCKQQILVKLFKCLLCFKLYLCQKCYLGWKHQNHDRFIMKITKKSEWIPSSGRNQFDMNKLDISLSYFKQFKGSSDIKIIFGSNYEQFLAKHLKRVTMYEYLVQSLMNIEKEVFKTYKKLQFEEKDLICCVCRKKNIIGLRRLSCKHFMDQKCLKFLLINNFRVCPLDKQFILPGFQSQQIIVTKEK